MDRVCPFHRPGNESSERSNVPKIVQVFLILTLTVFLCCRIMLGGARGQDVVEEDAARCSPCIRKQRRPVFICILFIPKY